MTAIDNTPKNKNFLSPLNFQFQLKRAPNVNFFIQRIQLPTIGVPEIEIPTAFNYIPEPGNKLNYGTLDITFKVDEDFSNYLEIHNWIRALTAPESFEERYNITHTPEHTGNGIHSDISVIVLNSSKRPNMEVVFRNAYPVSLSGIDFDTTLDDVQYLTTQASFKFMLFDVTKIG